MEKTFYEQEAKKLGFYGFKDKYGGELALKHKNAFANCERDIFGAHFIACSEVHGIAFAEKLEAIGDSTLYELFFEKQMEDLGFFDFADTYGVPLAQVYRIEIDEDTFIDWKLKHLIQSSK